MGRKRFFLSLVALGTAIAPAVAQMPSMSTDAAPQWYYIKVKGTDTRVGLVFTLDGEKNVCGKAQIVSTDLNEVGSQLWRFEQVGEGRYMIYNMAGEGRALDIVYDATEKTGRCVLASEPSVTFNLVADGDYFHIVASQAAAGTDASEIYLHQGNSGYHFAVITTGSYYGTGQNSSFTFVPFKDYSVAISNDKTQTYYRLTNASAAYSGRSITLTQGENGATLTLAEGADGGTADAQWRMEAHPAGTGWLMINRAAEKVLDEPLPAGSLNLIAMGTLAANAPAWAPQYLGDGQYALTSTGSDGITRYLGADAADATAPTLPDEEKLKNSTFAWHIEKIETIETGVAGTEALDAPRVSVTGRTIRVEGCTDYAVYSAGGIRVSAGSSLAPGLYIVQTPKATVKVVVK